VGFFTNFGSNFRQLTIRKEYCIMVQILCLASDGSPAEWLTVDKAAYYVAKDAVSWALGETCFTMRGGNNAITGLQSTLELKPIICVKSPKFIARPHKAPPFSRDALILRDRCTCAYCGQQFRERDLTLDHVFPDARGGLTNWMNLVAACKVCNNRKDCRTPEEAKMPLLFVPYVPNLYEKFILANRVILADQHEFLLNRVSKNSRLLS
jgi:hypothetical protein